MERAKTHWGTITVLSWVFVSGYLIAVVVTQVYPLKLQWYDWVRDITNAVLAVAITLLSIRYGGLLTDFYSKLTGFGISEVRVDRHGADPMLTKLWLDRIDGSEEVTIVGTLSQGWFVVAYANLKELLHTSKQPKTVRICLLDPFGKVWRSKIESGQAVHERFLRDATQVFHNLSDLIKSQPERVSVQLYDTEPLSCVIARGAIYLGLYLPRTERKEIPEFTISGGSFLGDKVNAESVQKLKASAPSVNADALRKYIKTMEKHVTTSGEAFWSDPDVFCDFCKEKRGLPSEVSRRYSGLVEGSRIAMITDHFFIVPSLGPLVEDHALIVSSHHLTSSAQLADSAMEDLIKVLNKFVASTKETATEELFFEHGVPFEGTGYGGCGICHCHIHSIPVDRGYEPLNDLEKFLTEKNCRFKKHQLDSWREMTKFVERSYLSIQVGDKSPTAFVFEFGQRIESQLMRQFVATNYAKSNKQWDWRQAGPGGSSMREADKSPSEQQNRDLGERMLTDSAARLKKLLS
jgi:diadenosine tetraphosphate (Ap4A) HIT family hydrolase